MNVCLIFSSEESSQSSLAPVKFPLECRVLPAVCCPLLSGSGFSLLDDWARDGSHSWAAWAAWADPGTLAQRALCCPVHTLTCSVGFLHSDAHIHREAAWQCELWECHRFMEGWITCLQTAGEQSPTIAFCLNVNYCLAIPVYTGVVQRNNPMLFSAVSLWARLGLKSV